MAATHVRTDYRRLNALLRREGWKISAKRVYRLYDEENLKARSAERKKIAWGQPAFCKHGLLVRISGGRLIL